MGASLSFGKETSEQIRNIDSRLAEAVQSRDQNAMGRIRSEVHHLLNDQPQDPAVLSIVGLTALFSSIVIAAKAYLAAATSLDAENYDQKAMIDLILQQESADDNADAWVERASQGVHSLAVDLGIKAKEAMKRGELELADEFLQNKMAIENPFMMGAPSVDLIRKIQSTEDPAIEKRAEAQFDHSLRKFDESANEILEGVEVSLRDPNRLQLAKVISAELKGLEKATVVDLRANIPLMLNSLRILNPNTELKMLAFEGCGAFVEKGKSICPDVETYQAHHFELEKVEAHLPEKIDLSVLLNVAAGSSSERLRKTLKMFCERSQKMVIADDIVNTEGERTYVRAGVLLHPFKKVLEDFGFKITKRDLFAHPIRGLTGYLVAQRVD